MDDLTILFAISRESGMYEATRLAEYLSQHNISILFWLTSDFLEEQYISTVREFPFEIIYTRSVQKRPENIVSDSVFLPQRGAIRYRNFDSIRIYVPKLVRSLVRSVKKLYRQIKHSYILKKSISRLFSKYNIEAVVCYNDTRSPEQEILAVAQSSQIPTFLLPSAISTMRPREQNIAARKRWQEIKANHRSLIASGEHATWQSRLVAALLPTVTETDGETKYLPLPPEAILAQKLLGVYPEDPWILGSSKSLTAVFVANRAVFDQCVDDGIPANKLHIVGLAETDRIKALRDDPCTVSSNFGPLVVLAVSPFPEHGYISWEQHFEELRETVAILKEIDCEILLSLHPNHPHQKYRELAAELDVAVAEKRLFEILPIASLFICSYSSTIHWAIDAGVPAINIANKDLANPYDVSSEGIVEVQSLSLLKEAVEFALSDSRHLQTSQYLRRDTHLVATEVIDNLAHVKMGNIILDFMNHSRKNTE